VIEKTQEETDLQAWRRWETAGHKNVDYSVEPPKETVIEKKKWKNTW